jgi:IS605 OrfB family transposase
MEAVEVVEGGGGGVLPAASASGPLRPLRTPFVVREATGCAICTRLKNLTTREKHGRRKKFRQTISGTPTAKLNARIVNMAAEHGLTIVAVDPAYTSQWGAQHWKQPLTTPARAMTRHDAAAIAIGRRALGHPVRLGVPPAEGWGRTATPRIHQSDGHGHRAAQAPPGAREREETRPSIPGQRTRSATPGPRAKAGDQRAQHRSEHAAEHETWTQDSLPLSLEERCCTGG